MVLNGDPRRDPVRVEGNPLPSTLGDVDLLGEKREELTGQGAAVKVADTGEEEAPYWNDLRVDASEDPVVDLRETYRLAKEGYEDALDLYGDPEEDETDDEAGADETEKQAGESGDGDGDAA